MKYLIYRAFQKLWINKKIYFAIALELAIGITVVLCGISSSYSAESRLELYKQQIGEQGIVIEYSGNSGFAGTELPITVEDYETIKEEHGELDISYLLFTRSIYQTRKSFDVKGVTFVSMDTESFFNCFGFAPQENAIYLGTQATVFKEIFLEIFLLCFISGCIALMTAIIIVPYLSTSVFTAYFHWINVVVMLGIVFTITIISCICMIVGIRDVYPAKILKK